MVDTSAGRGMSNGKWRWETVQYGSERDRVTGQHILNDLIPSAHRQAVKYNKVEKVVVVVDWTMAPFGFLSVA